jgi:HlyD family secretion protein
VYLVDKDSKVAFEKVKTGLTGELLVEVEQGPKIGQEIITGPFKTLRTIKVGDKVAVEKPDEKKKGGGPEGEKRG